MKTIITLSLLLLASCLQAQEAPGLRDIIVDSAAHVPVYRYKSFGVSLRMTRDQALSPLIFRGLGFAFNTSSWRYNNQWLWQSTFGTETHVLENEPGTSLLNEVGFSYAIAALRELGQLQRGPWRFWLGPEARMFLNTRLHTRNVNNVASYDWATAVGVTGLISTKFQLWGRSFALSNQLQLPLAFLYARPPYAWGIPPAIFEEQEGAWKDAFQLGTLNNIVQITNQLNLDFYLRRKRKGKILHYNAYRLTYAWNYFQVGTLNTVQTGGHQLSLSRVITF